MFLCPTKKVYLNWVFWFFFSNAILLWMIGLNYFTVILPFYLNTSSIIDQFIAWSFLLTAYFGQLGLFACLAAALPTFIACVCRRNYLIFSSALMSAWLCVCLLCLDTFVFAQYHFHLNGVLLNLFISGPINEVLDLDWLEWLMVGLICFFLLGVEVGLARWLWKKYRNKPIRSRYPLTAIACLLVSYYMLALTVIRAHAAGSLALNQQAYTIPLYYEVFNKIVYGNKNKLAQLQSVYRSDFMEINHKSLKLHYPLHPLRYPSIPKPMNIVFIVIDTWRFDMMNAVNTPHIYQFAKQSWWFQQHFSGGNSTQPGIFSLFYSLPATYWTATVNEHKSPVFIDKLLATGYHIGIFASATLRAPAFYQNVFSRIHPLNTETPGKFPTDRDQHITDAFRQFVNHTTSPFFSFLFYDAAHSYCVGQSPKNLFKPNLLTCNRVLNSRHINPIPIFNRYKNALYYVDELVGQDLELLKKQHLLDNTIVVITGDHGNEFNDNHLGYWDHASNFTRYQTQTPLIVYWPGQKPAVINHLTTHYDIVPTFLKRFFGCKNPMTDYSIGQLLHDKTKRPFLIMYSYTNLGVITDRHIINIYPSGYFQIQDMHAKPLPNVQLPFKSLLSALSQTKRYYYTSTYLPN